MKSCNIEIGKEYRIVGVHKEESYYDVASTIIGSTVKIVGNVKQYAKDTFGPYAVVTEAVGGYFVEGDMHSFYADYFSAVGGE